MQPGETQARLRIWLTLGYALLLVYASLSPFTGWSTNSASWLSIWQQPLRATYTTFDALANFLAYMPLGFLLAMALHARFSLPGSIAGAYVLCGLLSGSMEILQLHLPRVSSKMDLISNSCGGLVGALLIFHIRLWPRLFHQLVRWRKLWFHQGTSMDAGLALVALWSFAQTNPALPMLGSMFVTEMGANPLHAGQHPGFSLWASLAVTLNLLLIGFLLSSLLRSRRHLISLLLLLLALVAAAKFLISALLLRNWALLLWVNSEAILGILLGLLLLIMTLLIPRHHLAISSTLIAVSYLVLIKLLLDNRLSTDAMSVYHWHYRHLLNYNGLARTLNILFPLLLLLHLWWPKKV